MSREEPMTEVEIESKLQAYSTGYIKGYSDAVGKNYVNAVQKILEMGLESSFFPLYRREPGKNVALAVLFTDHDFYMFFIQAEGTLIKALISKEGAEEFDRDWTFNVPYD